MKIFRAATLRRSLDFFSRLLDVFFAPTDARNLALFRVLYCGGLAATLLLDHGPYNSTMRLLRDHPEIFRPIRLFGLLGIGVMPPEAFAGLYLGLICVLCAAALGVATRWSLTASWIGFFIYYGTVFSMNKPPITDKVGYKTDSVIFVLAILSVAPEIGRWGIRAWCGRETARKTYAPAQVAGWPLKAALLMLVIPYFGGFWCKVANNLLWAEGRTLQAVLVEYAMASGNETGLWLAQNLLLCTILSMATLLFEASFGLILFIPRLACLYVPVGLVMHAMMAAYMDKNYFQYFALPYLAFLGWPATTSATSAQTTLPTNRRLRPAWAMTISALLAGVHLSFILARTEAYPFSAWSFFAVRKDYTQVVGYRLQGIARNGKTRWLTRTEIGVARQLSNDFAMRQVLKMRDYDWVARQLKLLAQYLPPEARLELDRVALVSRTARLEGGRFYFVDSTFMSLPMDAAATPSEASRREGLP